MRTKTMHIGEYCLGGTLRLSYDGALYSADVCKYKTKEKIKSASSQRLEHLLEWLETEITTSYYASKTAEWFVKARQ